MDCQDLVELVTDYLEGALAGPQAQEVEAHLQECVDCLRYLGQIQLTARLLNRLTEDLQCPAFGVHLQEPTESQRSSP